ncbi:unnamed protein product [Pedinophyceae sp. YPF-701]|nr:unnamed protein product [Pedinophyceae sp. YPF-701]
MSNKVTPTGFVPFVQRDAAGDGPAPSPLPQAARTENTPPGDDAGAPAVLGGGGSPQHARPEPQDPVADEGEAAALLALDQGRSDDAGPGAGAAQHNHHHQGGDGASGSTPTERTHAGDAQLPPALSSTRAVTSTARSMRHTLRSKAPQMSKHEEDEAINVALVQAAYNGDVEEVWRMVEDGADTHYVATMEQILGKKGAVAQMQVTKNASQRNMSPMRASVGKGHLTSMAAEFSEHDSARIGGVTALYAAAWKKHYEVVRALGLMAKKGIGLPSDPMQHVQLAAGYKLFHFVALDMSLYWNDIERAFKTLTTADEFFGRGVGRKDVINCQADNMRTPVRVLFEYITEFKTRAGSKSKMIKAFDDLESDFRIKGNKGRCPLDTLVDMAPDIAEQLVEDQMKGTVYEEMCRDALSQPDIVSRMLIRRAALGEAEKVKDLIVNRNADPNWADEDGMTALYAAARGKKADVIRALGELRQEGVIPRADPRIFDPCSAGYTLFHFLVSDLDQYHPEKTKTALRDAHIYFGNVRAMEAPDKDHKGKPLRTRIINMQASGAKNEDLLTGHHTGHHAAEGSAHVSGQVVERRSTHPGSRRWVNGEKKTPAHLVLESTVDKQIKLDIIQELVYLGADLTVPDIRGVTPLALLVALDPGWAKEIGLDHMYRRETCRYSDLLSMGVPPREHFKYVNVRFGWWTELAAEGGRLEQKEFQQDLKLLAVIASNQHAHWLLKHPVVDQQVQAHWLSGHRRRMIRVTSIVSFFVLILTVKMAMSMIEGPHRYVDIGGYVMIILEAFIFMMNFYFLGIEFLDLAEIRHAERNEFRQEVDVVFDRLEEEGFVTKEDGTTDELADELGAPDLPLEVLSHAFDFYCKIQDDEKAKFNGGLGKKYFFKMWADLTGRGMWITALKTYLSSVFNVNDITLHVMVPSLQIYRLIHYFTSHQDAEPDSHHIHKHVDMWLMVAIALLAWGKMARHFLTFQPMGPLVMMVFTMVRRDITRFMLILAMFYFGFVTAFFVVMRNSDETPDFRTFPKTMYRMFFLMLDGVSDYLDPLTSASPYVGPFLAISYAIVGQVLLLNLLVAMMATSYEEVWERAETAYRLQVVEAILEIDRRTESIESSQISKIQQRALALAQQGVQKAAQGAMAAANAVTRKELEQQKTTKKKKMSALHAHTKEDARELFLPYQTKIIMERDLEDMAADDDGYESRKMAETLEKLADQVQRIIDTVDVIEYNQKRMAEGIGKNILDPPDMDDVNG